MENVQFQLQTKRTELFVILVASDLFRKGLELIIIILGAFRCSAEPESWLWSFQKMSLFSPSLSGWIFSQPPKFLLALFLPHSPTGESYSIKFRVGRFRPKAQTLQPFKLLFSEMHPFHIPRTKVAPFLPQRKPENRRHSCVVISAKILSSFRF